MQSNDETNFFFLLSSEANSVKNNKTLCLESEHLPNWGIPSITKITVTSAALLSVVSNGV